MLAHPVDVDEVEHRLGRALACVVHEDVDASEPVDRAGERGRGAVGGGDVGGDDVGRGADGLDLLGHRLERFAPPGDEDDVGTLGREGQGDGAADSLAPTRDHGDPPAQVQIHRRMLTRGRPTVPGRPRTCRGRSSASNLCGNRRR